MIKKFKEFIEESIFNAGIERNQGKEVKKEDDIELLDRDAFCEYLKNLYTVTERNMDIENVIGSIQVPISRIVSVDILYNNPDKVKSVFITFGRMTLSDELINILQTKYKAADPLSKAITISWDGEPIPNGICIEIIDLLLQYVPRTVLQKNVVEESIFNAGIKRNQGEEERKEDNIDLLNCEEIVDYINSNYEVRSHYSVSFMRNSDNAESLSINMHRHGYFWISVKYYDDKIKYLKIGPMSYIKQHIPEIQDELEKHWKIATTDFDTAIEIQSEITNKDLIKVLDIAIDFNDPNDFTIKKERSMEKLSESIFNAGIKRNQGEEVRKEDAVNLLDEKGFFEYLKSHYSSDVNDFKHNITKDRSIIRIPVVGARGYGGPITSWYELNYELNAAVYTHTDLDRRHHQMYEKLKEIFETDIIEDYDGRPKYLSFEPKDGKKPTNKFCLDVIDTFIELVDPKLALLKKL